MSASCWETCQSEHVLWTLCYQDVCYQHGVFWMPLLYTAGEIWDESKLHQNANSPDCVQEVFLLIWLLYPQLKYPRGTFWILPIWLCIDLCLTMFLGSVPTNKQINQDRPLLLLCVWGLPACGCVSVTGVTLRCLPQALTFWFVVLVGWGRVSRGSCWPGTNQVGPVSPWYLPPSNTPALGL